VNAKTFALAISDLLTREPGKASVILDRARALVVKKYHNLSWAKICLYTQKIIAKTTNTDLVEIVSASAMDPEQDRALQDTFGKNSFITHKVSKKILGGIIIKKNNHVLDHSFKARIDKIKANI